MDHLAQDLSVALEETESCGPIPIESTSNWGMRRRTRSAGNLHLYLNNKSGDNHTDESSSSNSELKLEKGRTRLASFHQSDSDEIPFSQIARVLNHRASFRVKHPLHNFLRGRCTRIGFSHSLESDSFNEHSPARPNFRRKRKLKRMSIDETPIPPTGKRKRPQRMETCDPGKVSRHNPKIKPLHPSVVDKIERFCHPSSSDSNTMEIQNIDENCEAASESSISWSGGEGHEGDDELTDWAPPVDSASLMDSSSLNDSESREIRAGCRRLRDERPGFSINTVANERVAKFLQDAGKSELRIYGVEREKLGQLAALYSLELWFENSSCSLLRKTNKTPCMQPTQRHHTGLSAVHKRIRTHQNHIIS